MDKKWITVDLPPHYEGGRMVGFRVWPASSLYLPVELCEEYFPSPEAEEGEELWRVSFCVPAAAAAAFRGSRDWEFWSPVTDEIVSPDDLFFDDSLSPWAALAWGLETGVIRVRPRGGGGEGGDEGG